MSHSAGIRLHRWLFHLSFRLHLKNTLDKVEKTKESIRRGKLFPSGDVSFWIQGFNNDGNFIHIYSLFSTSIALYQLDRLSFLDLHQVSGIADKMVRFCQFRTWSSMKRSQKLAYLSAILFLRQPMERRKAGRKILYWYRGRKIIQNCRIRNLLLSLLPLNEDLIRKIFLYL